MSELIRKNANEQLNEIRKSMQDIKIEFNKETRDTEEKQSMMLTMKKFSVKYLTRQTGQKT